MARFNVKHKDDRLFVRVRASRKETFSDIDLEAFARIYIRGFLKPKKLRKNLIEYTGPMGISLHERMKRPVTEYEFFFIVEQIVDSYRKIQQHKLLPGRVIWDIHQVFFNESTRELQFLYVPFTEMRGRDSAASLMESVGYAAIPQQEANTDYISRFMFFLGSLPRFDAEQIEQFIEREDRSVVNTIRKHVSGQSGFMTDKQRDHYRHYDEKLRGGVGDMPTAPLEDGGETALLDSEATGLLDDDEEGTALLDETSVDIHYPSLYRLLTEETISIDKPVFRIGKEKSYVDYFVTNNNAVSRSHADIITRGRRYFVTDLNSKNRTYINNEALPAEQECEIYDGDHLKLANEEFVFRL